MTKLSLTRRQRKELKRPGQKLTLDDFTRATLTAKETKLYRNLIVKKLESMNVLNDTIMQATSKLRTVRYFDPNTLTVKTARIPVNRLANLQKNLTRRLLQLSKSEVERFLAQEFTDPKVENKVQIEEVPNVSVTETSEAPAVEA